MFNLPHNCTHLTCKQINAQYSPSQASTVSETRISRCSKWISKWQRKQRSNCQHPLDHWEWREFQKNIHLFDYATAFDCVDHNKLWKILQEMGMADHLPASWEICMWVIKQQLELDMEQGTCYKLGKEYVKAVYCHPVYLTYIQSTFYKMLDWMKHKLESRNINNLRYSDDTTLMAECI